MRLVIAESLDAAKALLASYSDALIQSLVGFKSFVSPEYLYHLVLSAKNEYSRDGLEARARQDASGFQLPNLVFSRDLDDLINAGGLVNLIRDRQEAAASSRFNLTRVDSFFTGGDPEDLSRLRDIASFGSRISLPQGFVRLNTPADMRSVYKSLGGFFCQTCI